MKEQLVTLIADMEEDAAIKLAQEMIDSGVDPNEVLDAGREAMTIVGKRYEEQEYFLPELIIAGDMLRAIGDIAKPKLAAQRAGTPAAGKVVIGTVAGDIHDLGKDVVSFMLDVNHFEVVDLGVDVPAETFVQKVAEVKPDVVGMSGFLTMAYEQMKKTVDALSEAGLRDGVKIMIGGAIMDDAAAKFIGADAYGADASVAVRLCKDWIGGK